MNDIDKVFPDPSDADIATAKAVSRRAHTFQCAGHTILCKPISRATWKRVQAAQQATQRGDDDGEEITEIIAIDTVVYPSRDKFEALLDEYPAAFEAVALDLIALAKNETIKRGKALLPRSMRRGRPKASATPRRRSMPSSAEKQPRPLRSARSSSRSGSRTSGPCSRRSK